VHSVFVVDVAEFVLDNPSDECIFAEFGESVSVFAGLLIEGDDEIILHTMSLKGSEQKKYKTISF
jgi:hypothetical protein